MLDPHPGISASAQGFVMGRMGAEAHENPFNAGTVKHRNWERERLVGRKDFERNMERVMEGLND